MKKSGLIEESSRRFLLKSTTSRLGRPEKASEGNVVKLFPVTEMKRQIYVLTEELFFLLLLLVLKMSPDSCLDSTFFL